MHKNKLFVHKRKSLCTSKLQYAFRPKAPSLFVSIYYTNFTFFGSKTPFSKYLSNPSANILTAYFSSLFISIQKPFNRNAHCTAAVNSAYHGRSTICTTVGIRCVRRPPYNYHNRVKAVAYRLKRFTFLPLRHKNLTKKLLSLHV